MSQQSSRLWSAMHCLIAKMASRIDSKPKSGRKHKANVKPDGSAPIEATSLKFAVVQRYAASASDIHDKSKWTPSTAASVVIRLSPSRNTAQSSPIPSGAISGRGVNIREISSITWFSVHIDIVHTMLKNAFQTTLKEALFFGLLTRGA